MITGQTNDTLVTEHLIAFEAAGRGLTSFSTSTPHNVFSLLCLRNASPKDASLNRINSPQCTRWKCRLCRFDLPRFFAPLLVREGITLYLMGTPR